MRHHRFLQTALLACAALLPASAQSPKGKLVFTSNGDAWIMNTDGTAARQLTFVGRSPVGFVAAMLAVRARSFASACRA